MARYLTIDGSLYLVPSLLVEEETGAGNDGNNHDVEEDGGDGANMGLKVSVNAHIDNFLLLPAAIVHVGADEILCVGAHHMYLGFHNNLIYTLRSRTIT